MFKLTCFSVALTEDNRCLHYKKVVSRGAATEPTHPLSQSQNNNKEHARSRHLAAAVNLR